MLVVLHPHSHGHNHSHRRNRSNGRDTPLNNLSKEKDSKIEEERRKSSGRLKWRPLKKHGHLDNINVRAAFIHVIGDLIQSIGVVIAGYIIWFKVYVKQNTYHTTLIKSCIIALFHLLMVSGFS